MTQNVDLRIRRTLANIQSAFLGLVVEVGFEHLTVQAITERAVINRATFYRHYADKYDLAEKVLDVLFQYEPTPAGDPLKQVTELFEHIARYADFFFAAVGRAGIPHFQERLIVEIEEALRAQIELFGFQAEKARIPPEVAIRYLAAAQAGFVKWWLEHDQPFPPETAAQYLLMLHVEGASKALGMGPDM